MEPGVAELVDVVTDIYFLLVGLGYAFGALLGYIGWQLKGIRESKGAK